MKRAMAKLAHVHQPPAHRRGHQVGATAWSPPEAKRAARVVPVETRPHGTHGVALVDNRGHHASGSCQTLAIRPTVRAKQACERIRLSLDGSVLSAFAIFSH